tara:strand:- start:2558 stop:3214 length:657 start_codon:yes stop_codon:yes gene_type:complete
LSYIGKTPTPVPLTSSDIVNGIVTGEKLNADVISSQTALAVAPADTDEFLISDAGVLKRLDASLIGGGGKVLQVLEGSTTTHATTTSTSYVTTGLEVAITPSATSSKILIFASFIAGFMQQDKDCRFELYRDSTAIGGGNASKFVGIGGGAMNADNWFTYGTQQFNLQKLDSPSSTSELDYKLMYNVNSGSGATGRFGQNRAGDATGANVICAIEIGA